MPFVDHVISDLQDRFDDHKCGVFCLSAIVHERVAINFSDIMLAITMYSSFIGTSCSLSAEFELWQRKWATTASDPPKTTIDALASCNATLFPNIAILLQILATLPVTTSTAECWVHVFDVETRENLLAVDNVGGQTDESGTHLHSWPRRGPRYWQLCSDRQI